MGGDDIVTAGSLFGVAPRPTLVGRPGNDSLEGAFAAGVDVTGVAAAVSIVRHEGANDSLRIDTLDGFDLVNSNGLAPNTIQLVVNEREARRR